MSLKRPQHSINELSRSSSLSVWSSRTKSSSRRSRRSLQTSPLSTSLSSTSGYEASLPRASAPRTVEIMWGGVTAPGFTLKRKRNGTILVSTLTPETQEATTLKMGSELRLVGGFPVNCLTLQDVKQVMLLAPKPVSLVFVNVDDVAISHVDNVVELATRQTRSISPAVACANARRIDAFNRLETHGNESDRDLATASAPAFYSTRSESNELKKRKVSKLQVALDRFHRLLNRPVRQVSLYFATEKSIVV